MAFGRDVSRVLDGLNAFANVNTGGIATAFITGGLTTVNGIECEPAQGQARIGQHDTSYGEGYR